MLFFLTNQEQDQSQLLLGLHAFSRAWHGLHACAWSPDWLIALFAFVVIRQTMCDLQSSTKVLETILFLPSPPLLNIELLATLFSQD